MITTKIEGVPELMRRIKDAVPKIESGVQKEIVRLALKMTGNVMKKLSGDVLKVRTGRLRRSIHPEWEFRAGYSGAAVGTNVEYAAIHEFGGVITRQSWSNLSTKRTFHARSFKMPERSFLRSALNEMKPEITDGLQKAVEKELKAVTKK